MYFYLFQLEIDPSEKKLFWRQFDEFIDVLAISEQVDKTGDLGDVDPLEQIHLDELPDQAQPQPLLTLAGVERVTVNTNDNTPNGLGRVNGQCQVLMLLEEQFFYIQSYHLLFYLKY